MVGNDCQIVGWAKLEFKLINLGYRYLAHLIIMVGNDCQFMLNQISDRICPPDNNGGQ
jgi:hypothetical protein